MSLLYLSLGKEVKPANHSSPTVRTLYTKKTRQIKALRNTLA